jgi:enamine deaminase RidA (YjgF/YER057c/UK114 family)
MAKMQLKKPILLQEEFAAGEVSNPNQNATPTVQTNSTTVGIDKTSTGDEVRAEIVKDVDTILANLEVLSKQITEEADSILENTNWGEYDALNENFMEEMLKTFKAMKFFARLQASWPGMYSDKLELEIDAIQELGEFEEDSAEKTDKMLATVKAKYDAKKKEINSSEMPTEKKRAAREQINKAWDDAEPKIKEKIKKKLDTQKAVIVNKQKQATDTLAAEMTEFEAENKIEAPLIQKRWLKSKTKDQYAMDNKHIEDKGKVEASFMDADDPERIKKFKEGQAKIKKQIADEAKEELAQREADLAESEKKAKERMDALDGDAKEANEKLFTFYQAVNTLKGALTSTKPEDYDDAAKVELKKLKKAYDDAEGKISGQTFVDGKVTTDKQEGEDIAEEVNKDVKETLADFKEVLKQAGDSKTETEELVAAAEEEEKTAKDAFETAAEGPDGEESAGAKTAKKTYLEAQIKTQKAKKADAESKDSETESFDTKISELEQDIIDLDSGGGNEAKTVEDVAKESIGDGFDDFTGPLTKEESEAKEEVPPAEEGGEPTSKAKYKDIQGPFKAKDDEGNDTGEDTYWAKLDDSSSAATVDGENLEEGRKTVDSSAFGDDKLGYNDQFRGNTSLSQSLASELGFNPKKPWSEGLGFDDQAMYSVGKPEGTIANDALSGKYTYAELLAMAKDHFGIKESEEIEEGNEFGAARAEAIAKGEKTFKVGDEEYPVEDVSKDDKENAEEFVEEAKKELPKKIKLYEGMSIANKFKALM